MIKVGDKVLCVEGKGDVLEEGQTYEVEDINTSGFKIKGCLHNPYRYHPWRFEELPTDNTKLKEESKVMEDNKRYDEYTFKTSSVHAIDWNLVASNVSRDKPFAVIEMDNGTFGVLIHNSVLDKAANAVGCKKFFTWFDRGYAKGDMKYTLDATFCPLTDRKDITKAKGLVSMVLNAKWKGKGSVSVTVKIMEVA